MSKYAILRVKKIKDKGKIVLLDKHNSRTMDVPNADKNGKVVRLIGGDDIKASFDSLINSSGIKVRKNAVLVLEYIATFSPEMNGVVDLDDWCNKNIEHFKKMHPKGILAIDLHLDETTPHLHITVAPLIDKVVRGKMQTRLSAKDFVDGQKKMIAIQDRYAESMASLGLVRGTRGSKMKHKPIKKYYAELDREMMQSERLAEKEVSSIKISIWNPKATLQSLLSFKKKATSLMKLVLMGSKRMSKLKAENESVKEERDHLANKYRNSDLGAADKKVRLSEVKVNQLNESMSDLKDELEEKEKLIQRQADYIKEQGRKLDNNKRLGR